MSTYVLLMKILPHQSAVVAICQIHTSVCVLLLKMLGRVEFEFAFTFKSRVLWHIKRRVFFQK